MDPKRWGPHVWFYLHSLPENVKPELIGQTVASITLPCPTCQSNFQDYREKHPPSSITTTQEAHAYISDLHNWVNIKLGKEPWDLETCKNHWCEQGASGIGKNGENIIARVFR